MAKSVLPLRRDTRICRQEKRNEEPDTSYLAPSFRIEEVNSGASDRATRVGANALVLEVVSKGSVGAEMRDVAASNQYCRPPLDPSDSKMSFTHAARSAYCRGWS